MNEEIDRIRKTFNFTNDKFIDEIHGSIRLDMSFVKDFKKLLNYIDKLQKENEELKKQLKVNNTFNTKESEIRTPRYIESTTLKRWWLE